MKVSWSFMAFMKNIKKYLRALSPFILRKKTVSYPRDTYKEVKETKEDNNMSNTKVETNVALSGKNKVPFIRFAKYTLGDLVEDELCGLRGMIIDVDPEFSESQQSYEAIPQAVRPSKNQPYYRLLLEEGESSPRLAYTSEQHLVKTKKVSDLVLPFVDEIFEKNKDGEYRIRCRLN